MKGCVKSAYKQVVPSGKPDQGGLHPVEVGQWHPQHPEQPQVQYEPVPKQRSYRTVYLLTTVLTLLVAALAITSQVILHKEYNRLKVEVDTQMQLLSDLKLAKATQGGIHMNQHDTESEMETTQGIEEILKDSNIVSRHKREAPPRNRNQRNKNRHGRDHRSDSEVTVVHLVIDSRHHAIPADGQLKTGNRGSIVKIWKYSDDGFNTEQSFATLDTTTGRILIKKSGLYYIYSQMTYFDRSGRWSHLVTINDRPFIKCLASEWGIEEDPDTGALYNTIHQCHTAAVTYINQREMVDVRSMYSQRIIHADSEMTFIGIVKLA